MYILVVDDDLFANTLTHWVLKKEGYEVETTDNPHGAMQMIERREPDLLLVDIMMPYTSGLEFAAKLREAGYDTPFVFMTAQDSLESKLQAFEMGADDYICKPFIHQEMVARVQAVLRRLKKAQAIATQNTSICVGNVELLVKQLKVIVQGNAFGLTPTETHVLRCLMANAGQVVKRDYLLSEVWNDTEGNSNIVDVYIRRLRMKIETNPDRPQYITSVRGIGYKFLGGK